MVLGSNESIGVSYGGTSLTGDDAVRHLEAFNGQPLGGGSKGTTYKDVLSAAEKAGVLGNFTEGDRIYAQMNPAAGMELAALKSLYNGATTDAQRTALHAEANNIRRQVGDKSAVGGTYVLPEKRDRGRSTNNSQFRYDYTKDPTYIAMYEAYKKNAELAQKNTLAHAAAMTGGSPSTYAVQAAVAASDAELNQLALQIPSLESAAYSRWANQRDFAAQQQAQYLNALEQKEQKEYERSLYSEALKRELANEEREKEYAERERALEEAALVASLTGDYTKYAELLGVPVESINIYQAKLQAEKAKSSGGGSSGGSSYSRKGITAAAGTKEWYRQMNDAYGDDAYHIFANSYSSFGVKDQSRAQDILDGWINTNVSSIKNEHGDTWVYVPGYGRVSYSELETLVDSGKVKEKISSNGEAQYISINPGEK